MSEQQRQNPFVIDNDRLDQEWLRQPQLTREAGRREADARHEHAMAKARLDVVTARLSTEIRRTPGKFGLPDKPTVGQVEAAVTVQKDYADAVDAVNLAKRDMDYAAADTAAFLDRRKALERLVELLALDYWAEREPRAQSQKARELADDVRKRSARQGIDMDNTD